MLHLLLKFNIYVTQCVSAVHVYVDNIMMTHAP